MRIFILVIDGFGIGGDANASKYGDEGSNTYKSISNGIAIPNLAALGLNNICLVDYAKKCLVPSAYYGAMYEKSVGKDTITGHFEMAGVITKKQLPTFPNGFPVEVIEKLKTAFKSDILGNTATSGTQIINKLGDEHIKTHSPIVYTSADSVLQIACHEEIFGIDRLYKCCEQARKIMQGKYGVGRIIARPFLGRNGNYFRTENRKDYSLPPPKPTMLDRISKLGMQVVSVGKINDIFAGQGITNNIAAHNNNEVFNGVIKASLECNNGLIFANFVDTDMLYGHRNNIEGFRGCIEKFDSYIPKIIDCLIGDDVLIITADHGCDPSTKSTDHSREAVPILAYSKTDKLGDIITSLIKIKSNRNLGKIQGFDLIAQIAMKLLII